MKNWTPETVSMPKVGIDGLVDSQSFRSDIETDLLLINRSFAGFVQNLESSFPSTVSIISRTASKLGMRSEPDSKKQLYCLLCGL